MERIYMADFVKEWEKAYDDWDGKFSANAKKPISSYETGYSTHCFAPQEEFWFHVWNGPHCIFGMKELIPGVTLVTGCRCSPMFYTPQEFVEKFTFSELNPFTGKHEEEGTHYFLKLQKLQQQILVNAKML